jgi:hypothetical protein
VKGAAESISSMDVQVQDLPWLGDRFGQWAQGSGLIQGPVPPMLVVERLEVAQGVEQMALVPFEGAVRQFALAGLCPALHDGVHPGYPDTAVDDSRSGIGQHGVEGLRELGVPVTARAAGESGRPSSRAIRR